MTEHIETGKKGEHLAACWLTMNGFQVLFKNWRHGHGEIDIIARKDRVVHFVEVKTRNSINFGYPEGRIDRRKVKSIFATAKSFLNNWPYDLEFQIDVISVIIQSNSVNYQYFENVFSDLPSREKKIRMF